MPKLKAILIDLDGTLRDTRDIIYPSFQHAIQVHSGVTPSREDLAPHVHHHTEIHKVFAADTPLEDFEVTYRAKIDELMPRVKLYEGAADVLKALKAAGYKLALVSAARNAKTDLQDLGLSHYFDVVIGGDDTTEHKPSPQPVIVALDKLDIQATDVVMFGDLTVDIQAAHAAGVTRTIGVSHGFGTAKELTAAGASYIIDSLAELPATIRSIEHENK